MEKKHISVIGSCVSRHLFNNILLDSIFTVDKYSYQICVWDLFGDKIKIDKEELLKYYSEEFTARMITYDFNKITLDEIASANSEYLIIDLYNIIAPICEFKLKDKTIYTQFTYDRYSSLINNIDNFNNLKDLKYQKYPFQKLDKSIVYKGLRKLAGWIKKHFDLNKVIIEIPSFADKYFDLENQLFDYSEQTLINNNNQISIIKEFSLYLADLLPEANLFDLSGDNSIAQFNIYDNLNILSTPPPMHYTEYYYIEWSKRLINLLNINLSNYYSLKIEPNIYECIRYKNLYLKSLKNKKLANENLKVNEYNLNDYVSNIENLSDFIIIISAKDECSNCIKSFTNKSLLDIKMNVKYRQSYIAIIDKSRNFVKEIVSNDSINYEYKNDLPHNAIIRIKSAGYECGNMSSIVLKINDSTTELSLNKRGLNFVLLNAKTLDVVDTFKCDTHLDPDLTIKSIYLSKIKIKV